MQTYGLLPHDSKAITNIELGDQNDNDFGGFHCSDRTSANVAGDLVLER